MKLWVSSALSPYGNQFGQIAVVAETRAEAITKARQAIEADGPRSYVPAQQYAENLLGNLETEMTEIPAGVFIDWLAIQKRR